MRSDADASARPPEACETLSHVRAGIDAVDEALVALLTTRQRYIEAAGRIKTRRDTVRDEARIEDVVSKVVAHARRTGLDTAAAEALWRDLIERAIAHEMQVWDRLHADGTADTASQ